MEKRLLSYWSAIAVVAFNMTCSTTSKQSAPSSDLTPPTLSTTSSTAGGMVITDEMIGRSRGEMNLKQSATDPQYGYSQGAPVMVGGGFGSGSERTYQFLNTLRGPHGENLKYDRIGTCCPFKSPNSPFDGEAILEVYEITIPGVESPKRLYFNWYDTGDVLIPVGLSAHQ